jgi:hypothetical protein
VEGMVSGEYDVFSWIRVETQKTILRMKRVEIAGNGLLILHYHQWSEGLLMITYTCPLKKGCLSLSGNSFSSPRPSNMREEVMKKKKVLYHTQVGQTWRSTIPEVQILFFSDGLECKAHRNFLGSCKQKKQNKQKKQTKKQARNK